MSEIQHLRTQKYILLETYRKNNQPVKTPIWFVIHNEMIHVITREDTGKVKRLKNNPTVKITPCTFSGKPTGKDLLGTANRVTEEDSNIAIELRKKKYGIMERIARFVSKGKGDLVVFSIKLESA